MKTIKFMPVFEEALKDGVSEILMQASAGPAGTSIQFKYPSGQSRAMVPGVQYTDVQNFARNLQPAPTGTFPLGKSFVLYHLDFSNETVQMHFSLKRPAVQAFDLAPHVFDNFMKPGALSFVTGLRSSGKSQLIKVIGDTACDRKKLVTFLTAKREFEIPKSSRLMIPRNLKESSADLQQAMIGQDVLLLDLEQHIPADEILQAAESGSAVVATISAPHVISAILRFLSQCKTPLARERFSQVFESAVGLFTVLAPQGGGTEYIPEILLVNAQLRSDLLSGRFEALSKQRNFNQSLVQLLLKRKIDLKVGFQLSPDPEELDSMLKKIGF